MLSYLPEPSWLNGPPDPPPSCGKCPHCHAELYLNAAGDLETTQCSCGTALCCEECPRCSQCGDKVCSQCHVKFTSKGKELRVCAGCHQVYLDDVLDTDEPEIDPIEAVELPRNQHVHSALRDILNAISPGVRQ